MKKIKMTIALGIAVFAGAVAYANSASFETLFYIDPIEGCTDVNETRCQPGLDPCLGTGATPANGLQLFEDANCSQPLTKIRP